jgi:hypothetical protein
VSQPPSSQRGALYAYGDVTGTPPCEPYEPPDLGWYCTPCGERHQFGDICWYWDRDPEDNDD